VSDDRFVVEVKRSGGIAGRTVTYVAESAALSTEEAEHLKHLIEASGLNDLSDKGSMDTGPVSGADRFQYTVTVQNANGRSSCTTNEASIEYSRLKELIAFAPEVARRGRQGDERT